jgi:competence protein ComEC
MNNRAFYCAAAGFTLGVLISSFVKMGFSFFLFLSVLSFLVCLYGRFFAESKAIIILLAVFVFSFGLGILRYEMKEATGGDNLSVFTGEKVILTGTVGEEPAVKEQTVQLTVLGDSISLFGKKEKISEKILVSAGLFPEFKYGDYIEAEGKIEKPQNFSTTTGNSFDYAGFLAKDDIFYEMSFAQVKILSSGHGTFIKNGLYLFKNAFMGKINMLMREPESALLGGLLLGAKNSLGKDWQNEFRQAGVSHIVALSGYNITIVAVGIMAVLAFLPRFLAMSFGAIGILLFAVMTGGSATVLRASVMALLVLLAKATGRTYDVTRALLVAGIFMLIQNPKILVFDISFQLSFLSTVALIFVSPIIERKMTFITEKYKLRELIVATISTQIFVLPFIFYKMGMISLVSLPVNLLILPFIPAIMLFGFIAGMLGFISALFAWPFALVTSGLLTYTLWVIDTFARLPFSSLNIANFPLGWVIIIYAIFIAVILYNKRDEKYQALL